MMHKADAKTPYALGHDQAAADRLEYQNILLRQRTELHITRAGLTEGMHVLEIGCGTGVVSLHMAKIVGDNGSVTALDLSQEMLVTVKASAEKQGLLNIKTECANITEIALEPNTFDFIYCRCVLMHIQEPLCVLKKILSALKPGGVFACQEPVLTSHFLRKRPGFFDEMNSVFRNISNDRNVNYDIGSCLVGLFEQAGFSGIQQSFSQDIISINTMKPLLIKGLNDFKPAALEANLATEDEFNFFQEQINKLPEGDDENDDYCMSQQWQVNGSKFF